MRSPPDFITPRPPTDGNGWWIVSLVIHIVVASVFFGAAVVDEGAPVQTVTFVQLEPPAGPDFRPLDLPWDELVEGPAAEPVAAAVPQPLGPALPVEPPVETEDAGAPEGDAARRGEGEAVILGDSVGEVAVSVGGRGRGRVLAPSYGTGRLWAQQTSVMTLGDALAAIDRIDNLDTIIAQRILAFLDTIPRDSFAIASAPSWTTEIDGQVFGIDGRWVHLGPIKIPTALLALIPLPQGNIEEARAHEQLQRMRESLLRQAQTMQNRAEINDYIREMRERRDDERTRERRRGQRRPVVVPSDTVIP